MGCNVKDFVETERLIMHRHIFEDGTLFQQMKKKRTASSPLALAAFIKNNKEVTDGIFGWWLDISSPYSAAFHIKEDEHLWRHKKQLQYYLYDKKTSTVGVDTCVHGSNFLFLGTSGRCQRSCK